MTNEAALPEQCRQNGCTDEDCVCWQDEDEAEDAKLLDAAFARTDPDPDPAGWTIEYIDDARMLTVLGPGGHQGNGCISTRTPARSTPSHCTWSTPSMPATCVTAQLIDARPPSIG